MDMEAWTNKISYIDMRTPIETSEIAKWSR